eukprot:XP_008680568.2 uncharacterized protein LOC103655622 [Zea mays]
MAPAAMAQRPGAAPPALGARRTRPPSMLAPPPPPRGPLGHGGSPWRVAPARRRPAVAPPSPVIPSQPLPTLGARLRAVRPRWLAGAAARDLAVAAMAPPARCPPACSPSPTVARPGSPAMAARPRPLDAPLPRPRRPALPWPWWRGLGAAVARPWRGPGSRPPWRPAPARRDHGVSARRGLELGPACLWRAALSSASARPRAVSLDMAPLSPAACNACACVLAWCTDDISGWTEDLFTARKSAINLLGVIALSKGPPVASAASKRKKGDKNKGKSEMSSIGELLVIPFLSKFPIPSHGEDASSVAVQNYFGVLMAYGGLQDFLTEKKDLTITLIRNQILPLYSLDPCSPYLISTANWVIGQLAICLPEDMSSSIYQSLMKALTMEYVEDITCYPVCASASGAIAELIENSYVPPDWLILLQVVLKRISTGDENESALLFKLLGTIVEGGQEKVVSYS